MLHPSHSRGEMERWKRSEDGVMKTRDVESEQSPGGEGERGFEGWRRWRNGGMAEWKDGLSFEDVVERWRGKKGTSGKGWCEKRGGTYDCLREAVYPDRWFGISWNRASSKAFRQRFPVLCERWIMQWAQSLSHINSNNNNIHPVWFHIISLFPCLSLPLWCARLMCITKRVRKWPPTFEKKNKKWEHILTLLQEGPLAAKGLWDSYSAGRLFSQILIQPEDNLIKFSQEA